MNRVKVWPHLTVIFVVFAALGVAGAALWMRKEPKASALAQPSAARVERVDGAVGLNRSLGAGAPEDLWAEVTPNTPLTVGDRLYAREGARAGIAFTGRNYARLEPDSSLDVIALDDRRTQLALREGSAIFNIGALDEGELFEVATPFGAVDLQQPGLYEVGYNDDGSAFVSVLSGLAQVVGLAGSGQISKGEMLTLLGQTAAQVVLSRLSPDYAGGLLDDYYGYQYPGVYDGRYRDYDAYLGDPYYYDPYNRYQSYRYVSADVPGAHDLDFYGDWQDLNGYGHAWRPRVDDGWAPYRQGHWTMDEPYGLTWVSSEPWGYAPYHYGRWVSVDNQWFWVPEDVSRASYAPALVAFLPLPDANQIGWVPLGPGDPYAPAYYDPNWQPHYAGGAQALPAQVVNLVVPGAVTVVSTDDFGRPVDARTLARVDAERLGRARPVLDPLSVAMVRQAALTNAIARRGFVLPPGLAKRLDSTQVFAGARPEAPPFREDLPRALRVEPLPDKQKREKLRFKDERESAAAPQADANGGAGEDRRARRELRREERVQERAAGRRDAGPPQGPPRRFEDEGRARAAEQQHARGERVGLLRQEQREAERRRVTEAHRQNEGRKLAQQQAAQQAAAQREQRQLEKTRPQQPQPQAQRVSPGQMRKQQGPAGGGGGGQGQAHQGGKDKGKGQGPSGKGKGRP